MAQTPETRMQDPMTDRDTMDIDDQEADWAAADTQPDQGSVDPKSEGEERMEVSSDEGGKGRIAPEVAGRIRFRFAIGTGL